MFRILSLIALTLLCVVGCADDADAQQGHSPVDLRQSLAVYDSEGVRTGQPASVSHESKPAAAVYFYRYERVCTAIGCQMVRVQAARPVVRAARAPVRVVRGVLRVRPVRGLLGRLCGRRGCR